MVRATNAALDAISSAVVMALLLVPCVGRGQPSPAEDPASSEARAAEAASAAREGKTLFEAGLYDAAIERFEASFAIVPAAETQFAIAEVYRAKGDTANALRAYKLYQALKGRENGTAGSANASANAARSLTTHEETSPEHIEPSQLPATDSARRPVLSRALVQRRLILPPGVAEGGIATGFGHQTYGQHSGSDGSWSFVAVGGGGQIGFSAGEVFFEGQLVILHNDPAGTTLEVPVFQRASAGMTLRIAEDTGVGARVTGVALGSSYRGYAPSVFFEHKMRPSESGAIVVIGAASYLDQNLVSGAGYTHTARGVAAGGGAAIQVQVHPAVAIEAFGTISEAWFFEDLHPGSPSQQIYSYGGDVVVAVSDHLDVVPFFSAAPIGDTDTFTGGLQVMWH